MLRNWALALRPSLSLDFLAGLNDSRITYSGGANGTRVNSSGNIVAATTPRFDYDPVTLAAKGLLVEEARTNLLSRSAEFDNAFWFKDNTTVSADAITSPDGTANADKVVETATTATHGVTTAAAVTITAGASYTETVYFKAAERTFVRVQFCNSAFTNGVQAEYNLSTGVVAGSRAFGTGTLGAVSITDAGGGWYRCSISGIVDGASTSAFVTAYIGTSSSVFSYAGNASNGVYMWGAQFEAGSFPTSYIPTTSASVTRTADSAVMTGTNFSRWYNQGEGTFVFAGDRITAGGSDGVLFGCAQTATFNNSIYAINSTGAGNTVAMNYVSGGVLQANVGRNPASILVPFKLATSYAANSFAGTVDAQTLNTDASGTVPVTMEIFALGMAPWDPTVGKLNGHIRSIVFYPSARPGSLQALSS